MKYFAHFYTLSLILLVGSLHGAATQVSNQTSPYISIRSQGTDAARSLVGQTNHINLFDIGGIYGTKSLTFEYTKSFNSLRIAQCLFGSDLIGSDAGCRTIKVSGSGVEGRNADKDWLADYFGLPRDYQSTISICPRIENVIADFDFYLGLDSFVEGMWARIHFPLTYTKWNLNFSECINNSGNANHHPGYFNGFVILGNAQTSIDETAYPNAYGVSRTRLVDSFGSFACNNATPDLGSAQRSVALTTEDDGKISTGDPAIFPGVTFNPLCNAQFLDGSCGKTTRVGLADLQFALGWNAFQSDDHHVGFGLRFSAPTGNSPKGDYLFEPIIGNGNHWELGGMFTSHSTIWRSDNEHQSLGFYFDANITHLFKTTQRRTFDLKGKGNSRYMLAQKMKSPTDGNLFGEPNGGTATAPNAQFDFEYTPVANLTTLEVDVSVRAQADIVAMFSYQRGDFVWDLGYNLWIRSCDTISYDCNCKTPLSDGNTWVLKGDAQVYGYLPGEEESDSSIGIPLSASQIASTIHGGTNGYTGLNTQENSSIRPTTNPNVDNAQPAVDAEEDGATIFDNPNTQDVPILGVAGQQVNTSVNPIFLNDCDIDFDGARTKGLSHKLFTHISYTWSDYREHWEPYLGCGAFGEFFARTESCNLD